MGLMAKAALDGLASGESDKTFHENKLATARFYMERIMPETALRLHRVTLGADSTMALPAEAF